LYSCKCECGNGKIVTGTGLLSGYVKDCGCKSKDKYKNEFYELYPYLLKNVNFDCGSDVFKCDFYSKDRSIAIDFSSDYDVSSEFVSRNYLWDKCKKLSKIGVSLIRIFEYEWISNKDKIVDFINRRLCDLDTIGARECNVIELDTNSCRNFENLYHIQGSNVSSVRIGLTYKSQLVGEMTFGLSRFSYDYEYEMIRLTYGDIRIIGGTEKMLRYFINNYEPKSIVTFCDRSKFDGKVYERVGFRFNAHSQANYKWVSYNDGVTVFNRIAVQKHKLIEQGYSDYGETEYEIMSNRGFIKVYDCGNDKYIMFIS
jgi:hypothetical protein